MKLLSRPPVSTAQLIDPHLYQINERPRQGTIGLVRLIPVAESLYQTTLGRANVDLLGEIHASGTGRRLPGRPPRGGATGHFALRGLGDQLQPAGTGGVFVTSYARLVEAKQTGMGIA